MCSFKSRLLIFYEAVDDAAPFTLIDPKWYALDFELANILPTGEYLSIAGRLEDGERWPYERATSGCDVHIDENGVAYYTYTECENPENWPGGSLVESYGFCVARDNHAPWGTYKRAIMPTQ